MKTQLKYALALALLGSLLGARSAHADPTTPAVCILGKGSACTQYGKQGVCVATTCVESTPNGDINYDCLVCDTGGGAGGATGTSGAAGTSGAPGSAGMTASAGAPNGGAAAGGGAPSAGATNSAGTAGSPSSAGSPSVAGAPSMAGSAGSAGDMTGSTEASGCSCSMRSLGTEQSVAACMLGIGALAFGVSRRRRR